ncbi:PQQ-dependent sugar dehydrogenase [Microvirga sp.]|uniref:PQQ-dependent sugar dehydrogenase n=1 Tax=Microvirga sp. TaxID=1873136 RepID=UPI001FEF4A05|nr:PQQ-dependent sugar dehydrogenase [Microvirga sp.]
MFQTVFATAPAGDANRLFVAEKGFMDENGIGKALVKVVNLQNPTAAAETILTISPISSGNETGLLGLALHPEFALAGSPHRGKLYVNYTASTASGTDQVIVEYIFNPENLAAGPTAPPKTIMTIDYATSNHRAGWMEFGPDKKLYIATGEDQDANNSQTIMQGGSVNLKGKILRIDVNGDSFPGDENNNYGIPTDNPTSFVNINGTFAPSAIWAVGLRNPWRCSFDEDGRLYIADVGDRAYEEINIGTAGANYGWRPTTGGAQADGPQGNGYTDPVYAYQHNVMGRSITGGYVYEGPGEFKGHYIFGDYGNGQIFAIDLRVAGSQPVNITSRIAFPNNTSVGAWQFVSFGQDGQGNLYVLGMNGRILKLDLSGSTTDLGDTLAGDDGDDTIYGGAGNDTISGDAGADTLNGGADSDVYYVDGSDRVFELANQGTDEVCATESFTLGAGQAVEILRAWPADCETAIDLTGNELAQRLIGNEGTNVLDGRGGADTLEGGAGNDTYVVYGIDKIDETIEVDGVKVDAGGTDTVRTAVNNYTLGANLENLILLGTTAINGNGNDLANTITGNDAANSLSGADGVDILTGGDGSDTLNGGEEADRLDGGRGDDTYILDGDDTIVEGAEEGTDTVRSAQNYTLGGNLENLILLDGAETGMGNILDNIIIGNGGTNILDGKGGQIRSRAAQAATSTMSMAAMRWLRAVQIRARTRFMHQSPLP